MVNHRANSERSGGGVALGAMAAAAAAAAAVAAAAALSGAGTANANCASISGINNGGGCTSTPGSFAVGAGSGTTATAVGFGSGAIALGPTNAGTDRTTATTLGNGSFAIAAGRNTNALTLGNFSGSVAQGEGASPANPVTAIAGLTPADNGNFAFNVGGTSTGPATPILLAPPGTPGVPTNLVIAGGQGNLAANLGGSQIAADRPNRVQAIGLGNAAVNVGGTGNQVQAGQVFLPFQFGGSAVPLPVPSTASTAFNFAGSNNDVIAQGPFASANAFGVSAHNIPNLNPVVALPGQVRVVTPANP